MDRYQKIKVLGRGSYGSAILVRERPSNQQRVMKEIDLSRMPEAAKREAQSEAKVLRALEHPNIVKYYDTFEESAKLYIVMEFADGGDLAATVKERKDQVRHFSQDDALWTFAQCCLALQHVHSRHIMHRDLKSQNIFLTKTGIVKLGDFGIAKVLDHTQAEVMTLIGTPTYLAPEVCDSKPYNIKADIWSIGVVMYELLALAQPFKASNLAALMMRILRDEPDPLPQDLYSDDVRSMVTWMLQKAPEKRPTVDELLAVPAVANVVVNQTSVRPVAPSEARGKDSAGRRPRSGASDRGERPQAGLSPHSIANAAEDSQAGQVDALDALVGKVETKRAADDFLGNRRAAEQAKQRAQGGGAARFLPGAQRSAAEAAPPRPAPGSRHRAPSAGDAANEFRRTRDAAAQAKSRADGYGKVPAPRCSSHDPNIGAAEVRVDSARSRRAAEEAHLQKLSEAAAQSRRDRQIVKQRMQELDQQPQRDEVADFGGTFQEAENMARVDSASSRRSAEDARLHVLNEAAAQSRRDRKEIQQRMQELEKPRNDATQVFDHDVDIIRSLSDPCEGAPVSRREAENDRLQALQEAAAQARQDRQMIQQKMQGLDRAERGDRDVSEDGNVNRQRDGRAAIMSARDAKKAAEALHLQALQDAAAESRRDRMQIKQKMQDEELRPSGSDAGCEGSHAADTDANCVGSANGTPRPAQGSSRGSRRAAKEAAEAQHVLALQEAAAEAYRERMQLKQKMQDLELQPSNDVVQPPDPACSSSRSSRRSSRAERDQEAAHEAARTAQGGSRGSRSDPLISAEEDAAEAEARRCLHNASADARREHRELLHKLRESDEESKSTLGGYSSVADDHKMSRDRRSGAPLMSSADQPSSGSSGGRRSMPPLLGSPQTGAAYDPVLNSRSRSIEVSSDSPQRPLGRSSSLGLAGSLLARSGSKPRAEAVGATSAQAVAPGCLEGPQSPQFGAREPEPSAADSQSFGGTWSKNLRLLRPATGDANSASAEAGSTLKAELHSSRQQPAATAGAVEQAEDIITGSMLSGFNTTLRMPDPHASDTPAEELLAKKLSSRLSSPPPFRATAHKMDAEAGYRDVDKLELEASLDLSGNLAALSQAPPAPSENPTLNSLSYTGTCTSSNFTVSSCIAAK